MLVSEDLKQSLGLGGKLVKLSPGLFIHALDSILLTLVISCLSALISCRSGEGTYLPLLGGQRGQDFLLAWAAA